MGWESGDGDIDGGGGRWVKWVIVRVGVVVDDDGCGGGGVVVVVSSPTKSAIIIDCDWDCWSGGGKSVLP